MRNYWDDPPDSLDESYPPILWKARLEGAAATQKKSRYCDGDTGA
jgi:hypothetical protein